MADSPRVDRILGMTRAHYRAPLEVRSRVRTKLMARGEFGTEPAGVVPRAGPLSPSVRAVGVAKSTAILFAGATFITGFWLGGRWPNEVRHEREVASRGNEPRAEAPSPPSGGASTASIQGPEPERGLVGVTSPSLSETRTPVDTASPHGPAPVSRAARSSRAAPAREPSESAPGMNRRAAAARAEPARESSFSEELALLQRAERAIRSGEPELALSFLDDMERRHPQTRFVEERTAARLMARCARREAGSRAEAEKFLSEHPTSVYSDRLCALCELEAPRARDGKLISGH